MTDKHKRGEIYELLDCLERNEKAGIIYHREGIMGDYDEFDDLEELIGFIKTGKRINDSIIIKPAETDEELCGCRRS